MPLRTAAAEVATFYLTLCKIRIYRCGYVFRAIVAIWSIQIFTENETVDLLQFCFVGLAQLSEK